MPLEVPETGNIDMNVPDVEGEEDWDVPVLTDGPDFCHRSSSHVDFYQLRELGSTANFSCF